MPGAPGEHCASRANRLANKPRQGRGASGSVYGRLCAGSRVGSSSTLSEPAGRTTWCQQSAPTPAYIQDTPSPHADLRPATPTL